jgi:thiol-disulfide isomerase/thioredoxin
VLRGSDENLSPARPVAPAPWDYTMELRGMDDRYVYASDFRGRVLFLNFWETWCAPCVAEMPSIERLAALFPDGDIAFACVTSGAANDVRAFLAKRG